MRGRVLAIGTAILASISSTDEASACVWLAPVEIGPQPTEAERAAHEKQLAQQRLMLATQRAQLAWATGIDAASELANMLVPNIRPVHIIRSSCGVENEIDFADGEETEADLLIGTRFGGRAEEFTGILRTFDGDWPGPACNAEFRGRFAVHLRQRLTIDQLRGSYIFLAARSDNSGGPLRRLMAFERPTRKPPLRWSLYDWHLGDQVHRWTRRHPNGVALSKAIAEFWSEMTPKLAENDLACPIAVANWSAEQAKIVAMIEERLARRRKPPSDQPR